MCTQCVVATFSPDLSCLPAAHRHLCLPYRALSLCTYLFSRFCDHWVSPGLAVWPWAWICPLRVDGFSSGYTADGYDFSSQNLSMAVFSVVRNTPTICSNRCTNLCFYWLCPGVPFCLLSCTGLFFFFNLKNLFYVLGCSPCMRVCVCTTCMFGVHGSPERVSDHLGLELWLIVGARNPAGVLWKSS